MGTSTSTKNYVKWQKSWLKKKLGLHYLGMDVNCFHACAEVSGGARSSSNKTPTVLCNISPPLDLSISTHEKILMNKRIQYEFSARNQNQFGMNGGSSMNNNTNNTELHACYTDTFVALHSSIAMPYSTNNRLVLMGRGRGGDSNSNNNNSNNSNSDIVITLSSRTAPYFINWSLEITKTSSEAERDARALVHTSLSTAQWMTTTTANDSHGETKEDRDLNVPLISDDANSEQRSKRSKRNKRNKRNSNGSNSSHSSNSSNTSNTSNNSNNSNSSDSENSNHSDNSDNSDTSDNRGRRGRDRFNKSKRQKNNVGTDSDSNDSDDDYNRKKRKKKRKKHVNKKNK